jgi:hypothetical protein
MEEMHLRETPGSSIPQRLRGVQRGPYMTRLARVIAVDVPHHVSQRGNGRRFILNSDADRMAYLNLLRQNIGDTLLTHVLEARRQ